MWETLRGQDVTGMVVACFICLAFVAAKAIGAWRDREVVRLAAELKMEMISRGMSAEDIDRVLGAQLTTPSSDKSREYANA
jgi:hypothetical protein